MNEMFQKIYADASDETKRAMNKSFQASYQLFYILININQSVFPFDWSDSFNWNILMKSRRAVELCSQPTGTTLGRRRLKLNLQMAWSGRSMTKQDVSTCGVLYCYQKANPVCETLFPLKPRNITQMKSCDEFHSHPFLFLLKLAND